MQVALNHAVGSWINVLQLPCEKNSLPLRETFRLDNEGPRLPLCLTLEIGLKFMIFDRKHPGEGEEVILVGEFLAHAHQSTTKQVFPCKIVHAWEMVDFLVEFHFGEGFWLDCIIRPADVPIHCIGSGLSPPAEVLGHFADHWILAIYLNAEIPEMLITILLVFFCLPFLAMALRLGDAATYSDSESDEMDYLELFIIRS